MFNNKSRNLKEKTVTLSISLFLILLSFFIYLLTFSAKKEESQKRMETTSHKKQDVGISKSSGIWDDDGILLYKKMKKILIHGLSNFFQISVREIEQIDKRILFTVPASNMFLKNNSHMVLSSRQFLEMLVQQMLFTGSWNIYIYFKNDFNNKEVNQKRLISLYNEISDAGIELKDIKIGFTNKNNIKSDDILFYLENEKYSGKYDKN